MLKKVKLHLKKWMYKILPFLVATLGQGLIRLLLWTCRWEVKGLQDFKEVATHHKCILMLWHNCLTITPSILYKFAPDFIYAALVSNSRDGHLIAAVIHSYQAGRTILVPHNARYQALKKVTRHLEEKKEVVIITPDGPRGPCYQIKPGVAIAARETAAHVVPLTWTATRMWKLNTWDKLKIPKPFSTIQVSFEKAIVFTKDSNLTLKQAQDILQEALPK